MRVLALLAAAALLAGCSGPADESGSPLSDPAAMAAPEPVDIHEVIDLMTGGSGSWSFDIAEGAKSVTIQFYATDKAVVANGQPPVCLDWQTPAGSATVGYCQSLAAANINLAPHLASGQVTYYEAGDEAAPGHYSFHMEGQPSLVDFHAVVSVTY